MKKITGIFCLSIIAVFCCNAQGTINISGRVIDYYTKKPISGASILIKNTVTGTVTSENGDFAINIASSGATLDIAFVGYYQLRIENIPSQNTELIDLELFEQNKYVLHYELEGPKSPDKKKERRFRKKVLPSYRYKFNGQELKLILQGDILILRL